jgi:predicted N-acetyltransferase YhbS
MGTQNAEAPQAPQVPQDSQAAETELRYEAEAAGFKVSVVQNDQPVAKLRVHRYTMHLAGAAVTMGGIADVVTHPAHRGRGHAVRLLEGAVTFMQRERYAVSLLFGISDFYWRFGYTPVLPEYTLSLSTRDAERLEAGGATIRPSVPDDAGALLELYTRVNAGRSGTLQRTERAFDARPRDELENWWFHPRRFLVAEVGGRVAGYAVLHGDPSRFRVLEVAVPAEDVATAGAALLGALAQEAVRRRVERVRLPLPPDAAPAALARQIGCQQEITYPANGDGMGRIVHLAALAEALTPAIAPRLAALPGGASVGTLHLVCPGEPARPASAGAPAGQPGNQRDPPETEAVLSFGAGRAVRLALPQQRLCQLLMGYRGVDDLRIQHPDAVSPEDLPIVRTLFPAGYPHMWAIDHF